MATSTSVSGVSGARGVRSGGGVVENHCTGLETRFNGKVAHATAGMSRAQGDVIVQKAIAMYQPVMDQKPVGIPFSEAYDPESMQPTSQWMGVYHRVADEVREWGLKIE